MCVLVVLHISYTLIGSTTEAFPYTTGVILLAGPVDGYTLCFRRRRSRFIECAVVLVRLVCHQTFVACAIALLLPHSTGVNKLTGSIDESAHSRSRCEVSWDRCVTVRWCGAVTTNSAVVLSCTAIHPLLTWWLWKLEVESGQRLECICWYTVPCS